jgi:MFS family permease
LRLTHRRAERANPTPRRALIALCVTQITGYGVLYYAFPVMLTTVSRDTGWSTAASMGAFSTGAIVSAAAGIVVGRLIDARGPRLIMTVGSVVGAVSVAAIAAAPTLPLFYAAWVLAGTAQAAVLYPPAFAALTGWYGPNRVRALTTLTLVAGFASTIFAPLTAILLDQLTWRQTYLVLGAVLAVVTIPLHALLLTPPWTATSATRTHADPDTHTDAGTNSPATILRSRAFITLSAAVTVTAFGIYAVSVNLVPLLTDRGMGTQLAAITLGLNGAGQVLGRLGYPWFYARVAFRTRAFTVLAASSFALLALALLPGPTGALIVVAILAGAIRGLFTLLQATAVADLWGIQAFGRINGVFIAPITTAIALAPAGGALLADLTGGYPPALVILAVLTLTAAVTVTTTIPRDPRRAGGAA